MGAYQKAPDELAADFLRFYQVEDWRQLNPMRAASLAAAMIGQPESWTRRKLDPYWEWSILTNQWGVLASDALRWIQWSKTRDGQRNQRPPQPFPRPWENERDSYVALPIDELEEALEVIRRA